MHPWPLRWQETSAGRRGHAWCGLWYCTVLFRESLSIPFLKDFLLRIYDLIGCAEAMTPEAWRRNNCTKVSSILWYQSARRATFTLSFPPTPRTTRESGATHNHLLFGELANLVSFRLRLVESQLAGSNYSRGFKSAGLI